MSPDDKFREGIHQLTAQGTAEGAILDKLGHALYVEGYEDLANRLFAMAESVYEEYFLKKGWR